MGWQFYVIDIMEDLTKEIRRICKDPNWRDLFSISHYIDCYFEERHGMDVEQYTLLQLDSEFGKETSEIEFRWKWDPWKYPDSRKAIRKVIDKPRMQEFNNVLDKYAEAFPDKEKELRAYAESMLEDDE